MDVEVVAGRRKVGKMTGSEAKAIRWIKSIKDNAVVTLDHIKRNEPNVSPMLYEGRQEKAETIIKGFEELEQYRAVGTVEGCRAYKGIAEREFSNGCLGLEIIEELNKYRHIGTPGECREAMEKQEARKPELWGDGCDGEGKLIYDMYDCPNCGKSYEVEYEEYGYCPNCGQRILWEPDGKE